MSDKDLQLSCMDCGAGFVFTEAEQKFYASKNLTQPKRCKNCRAKKKAERANREEGRYR